MKWVRELWADLPARIASIAVLASVVPTWFIWPEHPTAEAISALALAVWIVILWRRGLLDSTHPLTALGVILAASGLTLEAIFFLATDSRPVAVLAIWLAGVALLFSVWLLERRTPAQP